MDESKRNCCSGITGMSDISEWPEGSIGVLESPDLEVADISLAIERLGRPDSLELPEVETGLRKPLRIGIMGGTFDPIHYGHLVAAEESRSAFKLDRVIFVPSGHPPHKKDYMVSPQADRYLMTVLATITNNSFSVSDVELKRSGPSYTIDTIRYFRALYGDEAEIFFITGADATIEIIGWKDSNELLDMCHFIAATRPGISEESLRAQIKDLYPNHQDKLKILPVPALAISSTDIRQRVRSGRPIRYLLPESVAHYIEKAKLYVD